MAHILQCDIVTPARRLFSSDATFVVVPASDGEMGILPMHVPVVSTLGYGEVRVTLEGASEPVRFAVAGGYVQVNSENKVIVLADRAIKVSDIDVEQVRSDVATYSARLVNRDASAASISFLESELAWVKLQAQLAAK
ncbi:MAG: ATP synthase F1 subunit epsilon [Actinobacteria bacterium]|nr:ATP synthase F1 subunit epsilon [Actinomycetota bacterium]